MKTTFATLAAAGVLLAGTADVLGQSTAPNAGTTPGVQPQYQGSVPASPGSSAYAPGQQTQGAGIRPLPGEPGYMPGQSLAPGAGGISPNLGGSSSPTPPGAGRITSSGAMGGTGSNSGG